MKDRLLDLINVFRERRVLALGDLILDQFLFGEISRVSREAPVLILRYRETESAAGGGANAACNAASLGAQVITVGLAGKDEAGRRLVEMLPAGSEVVVDDRLTTTAKVRILGGSAHSPRQQIVRIDYENRAMGIPELEAALLNRALAALPQCHAVMVSDYGLGTVSPTVMEGVLAQSRKLSIPVVVDSRFSLLQFSGVTAMTPNISEIEEALRVQVGQEEERIRKVGIQLQERCGLQALLITRGKFGMTLVESEKRVTHIPIFGSDEVADVTGAGDTVMAAFTLALSAGGSFFEAAMLANYAAGLVVMKRGTATVASEELQTAVRDDA